MKDKLITFSVIFALLGYGLGYVVADRQEDDKKETDTHETSSHHGSGMTHDMYMVSADQAPTVSLSVVEDAKSGWNISLDTTNFVFTPGNVNGEDIVGEGHAHLYVDGEKIGRLYSNNYHYSGNFDGTKTFKVTLNSNQHGEYAVDGMVIESSVTVTHDDSVDNSAHQMGMQSN